jgi:hypothetical protein
MQTIFTINNGYDLMFRKGGRTETYQNLRKKVQPTCTSCSQARQEKAFLRAMLLCQSIMRPKFTVLSLSLPWTTMHFRNPRGAFPRSQLLCSDLALAVYNRIASQFERQWVILFSPTLCQSFFPTGQAGNWGNGKMFCSKKPRNTQFPYRRCSRSH